MYKIIALTILCIIFIEFIARSSLFRNLKTVVATSKKAAAVISSKKISDHWKEKSLPSYSLKIMTSSVMMLFILLLIILCIYAIYLYLPEYYLFFSSMMGIAWATVFSIAYAKVRFGRAPK